MSECSTPFRIFDADDPRDVSQWAERWRSWPDREVFAHPSYVELFAAEGSRPLCAAWDSGAGKVLYPFLFRDLSSEPYWTGGLGPAADITTPYGYGGPFLWAAGDPAALARAFWAQFDTWARQHFVVAEFVRFSLFTEGLLPYAGEVREDRKNIVRDLRLDEDALWMDFKHKVRKNVNKARRSGVDVRIDATGEHLGEFQRIYRQTLQRREAREDYFFPDTFFDRIRDGLPGQWCYFHAYHQGRVVSSELVLVSARAVYSFLGGTDEGSFDLRPNDLLKFEIMRWAKQQGKVWFVLGGGYAPEDGIIQYKTTFAPSGIVPFYTGHRTLLDNLYHGLVGARKTYVEQAHETWQPREDFFPAYRA